MKEKQELFNLNVSGAMHKERMQRDSQYNFEMSKWRQTMNTTLQWALRV